MEHSGDSRRPIPVMEHSGDSRRRPIPVMEHSGYSRRPSGYSRRPSRPSGYSRRRIPVMEHIGDSPTEKEEEAARVNERHKRRTFGQQSLYNLRNRLEEERTSIEAEKCVYLCTKGPPNNWVMVNVNESSEMELQSKEEELSHLNYFGCTVWNSSKIIIAGGVGKEGPSDKVFIYDTLCKTWDSLPRMNHKRPKNPILVAAGDQLFVFGGSPVCEYPFKDLNDSDMVDDDYVPDGRRYFNNHKRHVLAASKKLWAEFCNLRTDPTTSSLLWDYLPSSHRFPAGRRNFPRIRTPTVYSKKSLILFWVKSEGCVCSFNYSMGNWEFFEPYSSISPVFHWSDTVVVLEDFLFWHHRGTIYAHDLLQDLTFPMHTLSRRNLLGQTDDTPCHVVPPTFLVHVGKGTLCLICRVDKDTVWYCTFLVQVSLCRGPAMLKILPGESGLFNASVPIGNIIHALECSSA